MSSFSCDFWPFVYILLRNVYSHPLPIFLNQVIWVVFAIEHLSSVCILSIASLSDTWFAKVLILSVDGPFTLLIASL